MKRIYFVIALAVLCFMTAGALTFGVTLWYTQNQERNSCQALEYILHSNLQNPKFINAIRFWADSNGCQ
jgi:hypothetical protein